MVVAFQYDESGTTGCAGANNVTGVSIPRPASGTDTKHLDTDETQSAWAKERDCPRALARRDRRPAPVSPWTSDNHERIPCGRVRRGMRNGIFAATLRFGARRQDLPCGAAQRSIDHIVKREHGRCRKSRQDHRPRLAVDRRRGKAAFPVSAPRRGRRCRARRDG